MPNDWFISYGFKTNSGDVNLFILFFFLGQPKLVLFILQSQPNPPSSLMPTLPDYPGVSRIRNESPGLLYG